MNREYRCRYCGWFFFRSERAEGTLRDVRCPNRHCKRRQDVALDGTRVAKMEPLAYSNR